MEANHAQAILFFVLIIALWPTSARAQGDYGQRIPSRDGQWLLPVATRLLGSTDDDHVRRGSINSWDLSVSPGTPVFAAAPGTVKTVGCYLYEKKVTPVLQGYGCSVQVDHGNGIISQYAHCKDVGFYVKVGDKVTANSLLCQSGQTGSASWPHVHFTILRNGSPVRIDSLFDVRLMHYCHFTKCVANNRPSDPIRGGSIASSPTVATVAQTRYAQLLRILAQYPPQVISLAIMALLSLLVLIYWLGGKTERIAIVGGLSGMAGAALIVWLMVPLGTVQAGQQTARGPLGRGGDSWKAAYAFMRKWEGNRCVSDPIRTLKGITQGTYTAWRMSQGLGPADVCASLTEQQAEAIYYQRYWLASGANRLSTAVAIAHFDHAVNAGVSAAKGILAQCGDNIDCYIKGRLADYRSKGNYPQYGRAWVNRVNDLVNYLNKGR